VYTQAIPTGRTREWFVPQKNAIHLSILKSMECEINIDPKEQFKFETIKKKSNDSNCDQSHRKMPVAECK
jgi:hypothetical protein